MPHGDEAILRQPGGFWAEGWAIRWWQSLRTTVAAGARRVKPIAIESPSPARARITAIAACGVVLFILAAYNLRQRRAGASNDPPPTSAQDSAVPARSAHAGQQNAPLSRADFARSYPRNFGVLLSRSIFAANGAPSRRFAGAASGGASPPPMSNWSLKGITQEDARFTAFVEDATANKIFEVRLGDAIGAGRVCGITLHDLTYELSGNRQRLEIDNVSGRSGPPVSDPVLMAPRQNAAGGSGQDGLSPHKKKKNHS